MLSAIILSESAVLVANGEKPVSNYAKQLIVQNTLRICVDSNLSFFKELDVEPDVIIGDLDTVEINTASPKSTIVNEENQNKTDLEKSLDYCIAKKIKNPPMTVVFDGTSLIPSIGNQTQNIPPITSVKDKSVSSAAGITFDPIE